MAATRVILVATDFSPTSTEALRLAHEFAGALQARLHLIHVIPDPSRLPWSIDTGASCLDLEHAWRAHAERAFAALVREQHLPADAGTKVAMGDPAHEILSAADALNAAAIVLGTHGHGRLARFVMGSVADRVVRHANRPVLIVPPLHAEGDRP